MKCSKCHSDNPANSAFCARCGTKLFPLEAMGHMQTETIEEPKEQLTIGSTFAGRYQIIEELGKGGMGKVYKVLDKEIDEKVALKLVNPEIASDEKTIERFRNELKFARKITHKNVCRMHDLSKEKGTYYITMEFVPGEDLKSTLKRVGHLSIGKTVFIASQVCEGLAEAHHFGVVHRDLKPQNIMLDKEGNARIMDFGIARSLKGKGVTTEGMIIGTPSYMSPEQVEAAKVDQRSDIYSLGVILYEMMTGVVPFDGETPLSIALKHKTEKPRNPRELNEQIPDELNRVVLRCMEKNREDRYQSVKELLSELSTIEKGIPTTDVTQPEKKPTVPVKISRKFRIKKILIPASVVIAIALLAITVLRFTPLLEILGVSSSPTLLSRTEEIAAIKKEKKTVEPKMKAPQKPVKSQPLPPKAEARKVDVSSKLNLGIEAFNREAFDKCIQQMSEVLKSDPRNTSAQYFLSEAKKRKKQEQTGLEIRDKFSLAQRAFQQGDYQQCIKEAREILELNPNNTQAKRLLNLAMVKIAPEYVKIFVKQYVQSINNQSVLEFYRKNCNPQLFPRVRKDIESMSRSYDKLQAEASNIKVQFKRINLTEVTFFQRISGMSREDGRRKVVFEGNVRWEMRKRGNIWKIVRVNSRSSGKK